MKAHLRARACAEGCAAACEGVMLRGHGDCPVHAHPPTNQPTNQANPPTKPPPPPPPTDPTQLHPTNHSYYKLMLSMAKRGDPRAQKEYAAWLRKLERARKVSRDGERVCAVCCGVECLRCKWL
jgi:hypothetical protein